jgi:threonine/homoserine/homoserine lactone efflux protein
MAFETWVAFVAAAGRRGAWPPVAGLGAVRRPRVRRWFNRSGGAMLIGAGAATAAMRQG